jgi:tubulin-folding cofactor B
MSAFSKTDKQLIRDYVTAMDHLQYSQLPEDVVAVTLTHSNLTAKHVDLRLELHMTIQSVKERFYKHIGTPPEHQRLILRQEGRDICELADNNRMLGFYSPVSGMEIYCIDTDPFSLSRGGGLTDTSLVEKYRISDEAYGKRSGTMREYIQKQRALDPNFKLGAAKKGPKPEEESGPPPGPETVEGITVGSRCEVMPGSRRGTVAWIGELEQLKPGYWVSFV